MSKSGLDYFYAPGGFPAALPDISHHFDLSQPYSIKKTRFLSVDASFLKIIPAPAPV